MVFARQRKGRLVDQNIVPLHQLLQVRIEHPVVVELREDAVNEVADFASGSLVGNAGLATGVFEHAVEHIHQEHVVSRGVHGDVPEAAHPTGAREAGTLSIEHGLNNEVGAACGEDLVQAGFAGDGNDFLDDHVGREIRASVPYSGEVRRSEAGK